MAITDKLTDTFNAANPNVAKVTATRAPAGATLTCDSLSGWPVSANSPVHFSTYQVNTSGDVVAGTQIDWKGLVTSSTTIGSLTRQAGASDSGNSIGDYVEMLPTGSFGHDLFTALTKEHNKSDGSHGAITATSITNAGNYNQTGGTFTVPNNSVTAAALATNAITLGYASISTSFSTASASAVQVTGLSVTVTIPAGSRRIRISVDGDYISNSVAANIFLSIWDGTVGTGTKLRERVTTVPGSAFAVPPATSVIVSPVAGSKTYNIGLAVATGTVTFQAGSTGLGHILVEAI